ncbi:ATP-binding cassette domain-containing protein [Thalassovita sp.]|uniref:ATP-binding cassette domain-containing protein n=1 Tax=Thalassovita sp. TaxID=1979401 RepID=UPI002B277C1D|nr:ATP-binding cassette domain-containing protein [Thalassovita sp.]
MSDGFAGPRLSLQNVSVAPGRQPGLEKISFDLYPGEILAVQGDAGAGKTSLVRLLAGLQRPDSGKIVWHGKPVSLGAPQAAISFGISTVFETHALIPGLPIWRSLFLLHENRIGRRIGPVLILNKRQAREKARTVLAAAGVDTLDVDQPVTRLSLVQRRALAIARAVYFKTGLLVLDNVTSALSAGESDNLLEQIDSARKTGMSVIFCTANAEQADKVCDRGLILQQGRIRTLGKRFEAAEVKQRENAMRTSAGTKFRGRKLAPQAS